MFLKKLAFIIIILIELHTVNLFSTDSDRLKIKHPITIKAGVPFSWGYWGDDFNLLVPYVGVAWRSGYLLGSKTWISEFEVGYFARKAKTNGPLDSKVIPSPTGDLSTTFHAFPITVSLVRPINLSNSIELTPKFGTGIMITYVKSTNPEDGFISFFILKPGLDIRIRLSDSLALTLDNFLIISFDDELTYYYIPSLGISLSF